MESTLLRLNVENPSPLFSSSLRVSLLLLFCIAAEFVMLTSCCDLGNWPVDKGDEPGYRILATNILTHGVLSLSEQAPFEPSVLRAPGYPAFVAAAYLVSGRSAMFLRLIQFCLLGLTGMVLYQLAIPLVDQRISVLAAMLCVTYPPFVFQATYHLTETLATLLALLFVYLMVLMLRRTARQQATAFGLGVVAGSAALVRPSLALLVMGPIVALVWRALRSSSWKRQAALAGLVSLGFLLLIVPCTIRNESVARAFIPFGSAGGMSFYYSMRQYTGETTYQMRVNEWQQMIREYDYRKAMARASLADVSVAPGASIAALSDVMVDRGYARDGLKELRTLSMMRLIEGIPKRLFFLWSTADTSPWAGGGLFHRLVQLLHIAIVILVAFGCYLMRGAIVRHWPLWIIPLYLVLLHLVFHVEPRYSFPGRPFMLVFAAVAVERLVSLARSSPRSGLFEAVEPPIERSR
jgi:4-amino-4-deoxy-L-arabinose transferase-like glycosyltransferase